MPSKSLGLEVLYFEEEEDCLHINDDTSISISYYPIYILPCCNTFTVFK